MKFIVAAIVVVAVSSLASAQVDTSRNVFQKQPKHGLKSAAIPEAPTPHPNMQYRVEDRIVIRPDDLPNSLRETLRDNAYRGWENTTLYQDRASGEYYFRLQADSTKRNYFRFDRNGKPIGQGLTEDDNR